METGGGLAYVALAADTAGVVNVADCMAAMLLQRVLGMGASVKYGTGQGKLAQAAQAVSGNAAVSGQWQEVQPFCFDFLYFQQSVKLILTLVCWEPWL